MISEIMSYNKPMNKMSISRILSILSAISIPCNAILIFGIIIGGGFSSIDSRGFMFWGVVLIFLISVILTIISWRKIKQASSSSLMFSLFALIFCLIPLIVTMSLTIYNTKVWEQQKVEMFQK